MNQTFVPPEEVHVDNDDVAYMNNGDLPLNIAESEEAERVLDDPSCIQQKMDMTVQPTIPPLRHMKHGPTTKLGVMLLAERAKRGWTYTAAAKVIGLDRREVACIEQGKPPVPNLDKLEKFISAYSMDTKTVLRVYSKMKTQYGMKEPCKDWHDTEEVADIVALANAFVPPYKDPPAIPVVNDPSEAVLVMGEDKLRRLVLNKVRDIDQHLLPGIALQVGLPVKSNFDKERTFKILLYARCPICGYPVEHKNMTNSEATPDTVQNFCEPCNLTFRLPYKIMLDTGAKKEIERIKNEKNSV